MKIFQTNFPPKKLSVSMGFKVLKCISLFLFLCILTTPPAFAMTWNVATDFSTSANPNGTWTFGWETTLGNLQTVYDTFKASTYLDGDTWYDSNHSDYLPAVWKNSTSGLVLMHPGGDGSFSVVQWTAPAAGQY